MKFLCNTRTFIIGCILLASLLLSSLAAQENIVLGVQTTINTSSHVEQVTDTGQSRNENKIGLSDYDMQDENVLEEIHSSFEDLTATEERTKAKEDPNPEPTLQIHHQHANIATELSESGQAAVVYTLVDSATAELQQQAAAASASPEPSNTTAGQVVTIPLTLSDAPTPTAANDTQYIVRAEPRQDTRPPPQVGEREEEEERVPAGGMEVEGGVAEETNDTLATPPTPPPQEDIPSFSEWAQKQLAEAEKRKGENMTGGGGGGGVQLKVRHSKNYASPDCGAKVVGANPEAVSAGAVLSSSRDEYLLNTCTARIWFIVELCEAIQPKKVEIANFELFSSSPKEFSVYLSDRYPTRDWALAGRFIAQDERNVQAFNLSQTTHFGKYVKVEIHSHYGQEHYCPVSLFRVYGTSEIEVLDTVDEGHPGLHSALDDDDEVEGLVGEGGEGGAPKNLFGSARDAVLSIVKKAAEALAKSPGGGKGNSTSETGDQLMEPPEPCITPSHIAVCVNCSDEYYHRMYEMMSCHSGMLSKLLQSPFVRRAVTTSEFCAKRGLDLRTGAPFPSRPGVRPLPLHYLEALLPSETLAALCNLLAVAQKKVVLNTSIDHIPEEEPTGILQPSDEPTPVLPDSTSCVVDGNTSEESGVLATRPVLSSPPSHPSPLPIRPSRTLTETEMGDLAPNTTTQDGNTTLEVVATVIPSSPENNEASSNVPSEKAEKEKDNMTLVVETVTLDTGSLDSLFSELEQAVVPSPRVPPAPQKESVFVRLANRIKALERNMSLSGQYLEELSRRYKRQVEELQRAVGEERRRGEEREGLRLEQLGQLVQQVEALTGAVKELMEERDSWHHKATVMGQHGVIVLVEVVVFAVILYVCRWIPEVDVSSRKFSVAWPRRGGSVTRRKSVDQVLPQTSVPAKKRRPSEEALVIAGSTHQELLLPEARRKISKGETRRQRRKRRKELFLQAESRGAGSEKIRSSSLLDQNCTESVVAWWEAEEAVLSPTVAPPVPPPAPSVVPAPPQYVQTAAAQRQDRIARSSSENSDKENKIILPIKKTGPFKKIVKKFF